MLNRLVKRQFFDLLLKHICAISINKSCLNSDKFIMIGLVLLSLFSATLSFAEKPCAHLLIDDYNYERSLTQGFPKNWSQIYSQYLKKIEGKKPNDRFNVLYNLDVTSEKQTIQDVLNYIPGHQYRIQKTLHALTSFNPKDAFAKVGITEKICTIDSEMHKIIRKIPEYSALENPEIASLVRQICYSPGFSVKHTGIEASHHFMIKVYRQAQVQLAQLEKDVRSVLMKEKITYYELLDISSRYTIFSSPAQSRDLMEDLDEEYRTRHAHIEKRLKTNPYLIIMPISGDLSRNDLNALTTAGIPMMPVGLVFGNERIASDGTRYSTGEAPYDGLWGSIDRFAGHDLDNHGPFLYQDFWVGRLNAFLTEYSQAIDLSDPYSLVSIKKLKLALTYQALIKRTYFEKFRSTLNSQEKLVFDYTWFVMDHEMQGTRYLPTFNHRYQSSRDNMDRSDVRKEDDDRLFKNITLQEIDRLSQQKAESLMEYYSPLTKAQKAEREYHREKSTHDPYPNELPELIKPSVEKIKKVIVKFFLFAKGFAQTFPEKESAEFQRLLEELQSIKK